VSCLLTALHLVGGSIGEAAVLLSLLPAAYIALVAHPRYLGSMLVIFIPAAAFRQSAPYALMSLANIDLLANVTTYTILAGVQVDAPLVFSIFAFVRLASTLLRRPSSVTRVVSGFVVALWLVALVPAFLSSLEGQQLGLNRWSRALRRAFVLGGFFWGVLLAGNELRRPNELRDLFYQYLWVGVVLYLFDFMRAKLYFILLGQWAAYIVGIWGKKRNWLLLSLLILSLINPKFEYTWTLLGLILLSGIVAGASAYFGKKALRRLAVRYVAGTSIFAAIAMVLLALTYQTERSLVTDSSVRNVEIIQQKDIGYLEYKLISDRGPLWRGAIEQLSHAPYLVVPSGRPVRIKEKVGWVDWHVGVHNGILEAALHGGLLIGFATFVFMLYVIICLIRLISESEHSFLRLNAAGLLAIALVATLTLNMTLSERHGFLIWNFAGYLYGLHVKWCHISLNSAQDTTATPTHNRAPQGGRR
jgi:hypothetical protein